VGFALSSFSMSLWIGIAVVISDLLTRTKEKYKIFSFFFLPRSFSLFCIRMKITLLYSLEGCIIGNRSLHYEKKTVVFTTIIIRSKGRGIHARKIESKFIMELHYRTNILVVFYFFLKFALAQCAFNYIPHGQKGNCRTVLFTLIGH